MGQAGDNPRLHRIVAHPHDDRNRLSCFLRCRHDIAAEGKNHIGIKPRQFGGNFRKPLGFAASETVFHR